MIYLIEDKTSRRVDYGWTDERITSMSDAITVIANATLLTNMASEILVSGNVVLFHESFAQRENFEKQKEVETFLSSLEEMDNIYVAFFSGSNTQRKKEGLICSLHVQTLYTNLDIFIKNYRKGNTNFQYLLFGADPEMEERILQLIKKNNDNNIDIAKIDCNRKLLVFRTSEDFIQFPVSDATIINQCDDDCSDTGFIKLVEDQLSCQYDAIYIPLCMGETLSDFLGLRLAMFFRLYDTVNKYAHIIIYGVVDPTLFIKSECVEVLKMSGVDYILADCNSLIKSLQHINRIDNNEYRIGLKRIHLNVPTNIGDNHSVANKWGRSRWSLALDDIDIDIEKGKDEIENSLYFKYLSALYPPTEITPINENKLKIEKDGLLPELNILYVDDEADEGWYELLCHILCDENDIHDFNYVGRDMKSKSQEEIINYVIEKIKNSDVNLVILDLRLHPDDFNNSSIDKITGYRLLGEIKHYNRGIQVLMFSATNKTWNLQALQKAEVDGFIIKEAPENSVDNSFTEQSIIQFIQALSTCSKNTYRKALWKKIQDEKEKITKLRRRRQINLEYGKAIEVLLTMTEDALFSKDLKYAYATAFMNLFRIIEATANEWIDENAIIETNETGEVRSYFKMRKDDSQLLRFNNKSFNPHPSELLVFNRDNPTLPYFQKICNTLHAVNSYNLDAYNIVNKRNNFTHPNLIENDEIEKFTVHDVLSIFNIVEQLIMNQ